MITIKAEISAGSNINTAFKETIRIATILNCFVDFDFNGVHCTAAPQSTIELGVKNYHAAIRSKSNYKFAISYTK